MPLIEATGLKIVSGVCGAVVVVMALWWWLWRCGGSCDRVCGVFIVWLCYFSGVVVVVVKRLVV